MVDKQKTDDTQLKNLMSKNDLLRKENLELKRSLDLAEQAYESVPPTWFLKQVGDNLRRDVDKIYRRLQKHEDQIADAEEFFKKKMSDG